MIEQKLTSNLIYLREKAGLSINELCEKLDIDPIDYSIVEKTGIDAKADRLAFKNYCPIVIEVCNYYMVSMDIMMYEDITLPDNYDPLNFDLLKQEHSGGAVIDRKPFFKSIYDNDYIEKDDTQKDALKMTCYMAHKVERTNSRYWALRKAGKIPRHDFFEPED